MLKDRVRLLIDRYWNGSVNKAARALGVPQQTLNRIVSGQTPNPRVRLLEQIATGCNASVDWLLTGKGEEPLVVDELGRPITGHFIRLRRVLNSIGATGSLRRALDDLSSTPLWAALPMIDGIYEPFSKAMNAALEAGAMCDDAWAHMLEAAVEQKGSKRVLKALAGDEPLVALGFTSFAMELWDSKLRGQIARLYKEFSREPEQPAVKPTRASAGRRKARRRSGPR